jgi:hypothetical protein
MRRERAIISVVWAGALAGCVQQAEPPAVPVPVPFVVSDYYAPDGFWGDGEKRGAIVLDKSCPQRAPASTGDCYTVTYTPGDRHFAGINWQYPHNNWGTDVGLPVAGGATRITFQARGRRGGETVGFGAGQMGTPQPHNDGFSIGPLEGELTTAWAPFAIPLRGQKYDGADGLIAAFTLSLTAAADEEGPIVIYLDDLRWRP